MPHPQLMIPKEGLANETSDTHGPNPHTPHNILKSVWENIWYVLFWYLVQAGETPLDEAKSRDHSEVAQFLHSLREYENNNHIYSWENNYHLVIVQIKSM